MEVTVRFWIAWGLEVRVGLEVREVLVEMGEVWSW